MRRFALPLTLLAVVGSVACGSSDPPPPTDEAQVQKTGNGTGGTTGTTGTTVDYPKGPYSTSVGGILRDADFNGLLKPIDLAFDATKATKFSISDYYNPNSVDTKPRALVITEAARWCSPCKDEAKASMAAYKAWNTDMTKPVVEFVSLIIEDVDSNPAVANDAALWAKAYNLAYPVGIDPSLKLGDFFDKSAIPFNMIVDTKTMTIVYAGTGGISLAPGSDGGKLIQSIIGQLALNRAHVRRRAAGLAVLLCSVGSVAGAEAPTFSITETSVVNYRFDNRDNDKLNDKYGEWLNRLNVQATHGQTTAAVRIDSAVYFSKPDPNTLGRRDAHDAALAGELVGETESEFARRRTLTYGKQLSARYVNTVYPSKAFVSHREGPADVTVGDFYAQLGKGLVLSMRKVDELGTDTTIRGAKAELRPDIGDGKKLAVMLLAGQANPIRVDEVTGKQLTQKPSAVFVAAPRPNETFYDPTPQPTFAPDTIYGGRVEGGSSKLLVGLMGAGVHRGQLDSNQGVSANPARNAGDMSVLGVSLSAPNLGEHGSAYIELATQSLRNPIRGLDTELSRSSGGHGVYLQANAYDGPLTLTLEAKRYDRFFPLTANTTDGTFGQLQYNAAPTTELITNDTQYDAFNTCVTGARTRLDFRGNEHAVLFGSVGRYVTFGERSNRCGEDIDASTGAPIGKSRSIRNDVWDAYVGMELSAEENRTHAFVTSGLRTDDQPDAEAHSGTGPSTLYYREHWARWDFVKKVSGPFSVQTSGLYRSRHKPLQTPKPWREVESYVSLIYSPKVTVALGYEATTVKGYREDFYNGLFQYRISTDSVVRLFVGQTRQGLRCVSGICRVFPAYEGAKVEAVLRF